MKKTIVLAFLFIALTSFVKKESDFSEDEIKKANTTADASYLSQQEKDVIFYLNLCRINPKKFLKKYIERNRYVKKRKKQLRKKPEYLSSLKVTLDSIQSLPIMRPDKSMYDLAECFAKEQEQNGKTGHDREGCTDAGMGAECLAYGNLSALEIVIELLIDMDVPDYGHRGVMLDNKYCCMGVSIKTHKEFGKVVVLDFKW